jgi:hypothetical protein
MVAVIINLFQYRLLISRISSASVAHELAGRLPDFA